MKITPARKATLALGVIVAAAILAIAMTYAVSALSIQAIQESQDLNQTMLIAADDMEIDTVSGALRVYQYLETSDPHFRGAYRQHGDRFRQYAERFQALARFKEWQATAQLIAEYYKELDQISLEVMSHHDRTQSETALAYTHLRQLTALPGARLHEGSASGSAPYVIEEKIEAHLNQLYVSLIGLLQTGHDRGVASAQVSELRALSSAHAKLPLADTNKKVFAEFDQTLDALNASLDSLLKSSNAKRTGVARMMELQQLIIATRVRSTLKRHAEEAAGNAESRMMQLRYLAGGLSLLLVIFAARYVQRAIADNTRRNNT